jgi:CRP-like cAMP-binding protein
MEKIMDYRFLTNTMLFRGTSEEEAKGMLKCLGTFERRFEKGKIIYRAGECVSNMGLVLSGSVNISIDDMWGKSTILVHADPGQLFAETYACIPGEPLMVNVTASEKADILFLNAAKLMTTCKNACPYHNRLIQNLLQISAVKNLALSRRSVHTSPKSIRGRLVSYLSEQAKRSGSYQFTIPFNRQQLAEYLGVDRSAMSNELSKMQKDGIVDFDRNRFTLKQ